MDGHTASLRSGYMYISARYILTDCYLTTAAPPEIKALIQLLIKPTFHDRDGRDRLRFRCSAPGRFFIYMNAQNGRFWKTGLPKATHTVVASITPHRCTCTPSLSSGFPSIPSSQLMSYTHHPLPLLGMNYDVYYTEKYFEIATDIDIPVWLMDAERGRKRTDYLQRFYAWSAYHSSITPSTIQNISPATPVRRHTQVPSPW